MLQAILLDFDGIILESNHIKGLAFGELFEDYPQHRQAILDYHYAHGGISRFRKFEHIYNEILKEPLNPARSKALGRRFSEIVFEKVVQCPFVDGAQDFLDKYDQVIALFIISATPQEEIAEIVNMRELSKYFKAVYGSPILKGEWTKRILKDHSYSPRDVLWVGDALSDYEAAKSNDIAFAGRIVAGQTIFDGKDVDFKIRDLTELDELVKPQVFNKVTK